MFKSFFNQVRSNSEEVRSDVSAQPTNLICSHREHLTYYLLLITYSLEFFSKNFWWAKVDSVLW